VGVAEPVVRLLDIEEKLDDLKRVLAADRIRLACLFGSVLVRPSARDVDLAVWFNEYDFDGYLELADTVSRVLGTGRVHVVVLNRTSPALRLRALLEGRHIFAETELARIDAVVETLFAYEDYRHFLDQYRPRLERRCQEGLSVADRTMDPERVDGYLSSLDQAVAQLRRLQSRVPSFVAFQSDLDTRELCVHYLRIALESVLDICRHFLAVVGVSLVEVDTTNLIELAGERGLLDPGFAYSIRKMAGMRNAIVHVYWRLDYQAIYQAVTERLADLDEFGRQVRAYLRGEKT
jgi:uncharacterized protein YutE (UPF0331/DUF86 family)/predicted nucleotidyltransferase